MQTTTPTALAWPLNLPVDRDTVLDVICEGVVPAVIDEATDGEGLEDFRELTESTLTDAIEQMEREAIAGAGKLLAGRPDLRSLVEADDYFKNTVEGMGLWVYNATDPAAALPRVIEGLESTSTFQTIYLGRDLIPRARDIKPGKHLTRTIDQVSDTLVRFARKGTMVQVIAPVCTGDTYDELIGTLTGEGNPLGGSGHDQIMAFYGHVYDPSRTRRWPAPVVRSAPTSDADWPSTSMFRWRNRWRVTAAVWASSRSASCAKS